MAIKRLSPSASKLYHLAASDARVSTLIQVAPSIDRQAFERDVALRHGIVRSWMPETGTVVVEIEAGQLGALADLDGVIYVEAGQKYAL